MADISVLSRIIAGAVKNVDISANTLVTTSVKVGGLTPSELTKAILDNLIALQNGSDFSSGTNAHTHDGRYFTETEIGQVSGTTGSDLVGDDNSYSNFTPAATTVKGALSGIDSAIGSISGSSAQVKVSSNDTTPGYLNGKLVAGTGVSFTENNDGSNETLTIASTITQYTDEMAQDAVGGALVDSSTIDFTYTDGSNSIVASVIQSGIDHGSISGLADDDHTQYHNDARGDARYYQKSEFVTTSSAGAPVKLDGAGKIAVAQLPSAVMTYEGTWNASTNSPTLVDGTGDAGMVYLVSVAGSQNLGSGSQTFSVGDWVVYNGSIWQQTDNADAVVSVNGQTGVVVLDTDDLSEGTNKFFTDERAQDAVGAALVNSSKVSLTYDDGSNSIVADIVSGSLVNSDINASAAIAYSKLNLSSSIVNADVSGSAAIAYSKLNLSSSIVNADISASAAIVDTKLATISTANKVSGSAIQLATASGLQDNTGLEVKLDGSTLSKSASGVKVADGGITNTQVNASAGIVYSKLSLTDSISNSDVSSVAAIAYSKLNLSGSIVNADINASAAIAYSKLNLSNSIVAGDLTSASVDKDKIASNVFDQTSITGGAGTSASVQFSPQLKKSMVAGESFSANTQYCVRLALTGETAGRIYKADKDASSSNKYMAIGMIYSGSALSAGDPVDVTIVGEITVTNATYASGDLGKELFVGTSGAVILGASLANTTNEAAFCVGVAKETNKAWVDFKQLRGIA